MTFIVFYYILNSPFIKPPIYYEYSFLRNTFEIGLIAILIFKVSPFRYSEICIILFIATLYLYVSLVNGDSIKNVLELSSLGLFIFLVYQIINKNFRFLEWHRSLWVIFAIFSSLSALFMYLIIFFYPDAIQDLGRSFYKYNYKYIPIIGTFLMSTDTVPRFCGYFFEPICMGMFFSLNIIAADKLISNKRGQRLFRIINFMAGVCTYSMGFFIFMVIYAIYSIFSSRSFRIAIPNLLFLGFIYYYFIEKFLIIYNSLRFFSRINRYNTSLDILQNTSILSLLHGYGDLEGMRLGAHASINVLLTLILFHGLVLGPLILLLYMYIWKKNTIMLTYALYYGMILYYVFYPIIVIGIFLIITLGQKDFMKMTTFHEKKGKEIYAFH